MFILSHKVDGRKEEMSTLKEIGKGIFGGGKQIPTIIPILLESKGMARQLERVRYFYNN